MSSSLLPVRDFLTQILATRAKRRHLIARVSKEFYKTVTSLESLKIRSSLGGDKLVIQMKDIESKEYMYMEVVRRAETETFCKKKGVLQMPAPILFTGSYGGLLVFVCGSVSSPIQVWIHEGNLCYQAEKKNFIDVSFGSAGILEDKLFIFGTSRKESGSIACYQSYSLDEKKWDTPIYLERFDPNSSVNVSIGKKIFMLGRACPIVFDSRNGQYTNFHMHSNQWSDACVICEKLFVYYSGEGVMVYDKNGNVWKSVSGLDMLPRNLQSVKLVEYNGTLGALWFTNSEEADKNKLFLASIALDEEGGFIKGDIDGIKELGFVPKKYEFKRCISILF